MTLKRILWKEDMLATHGHKAGLRLLFCKCFLCPGRGLGGGWTGLGGNISPRGGAGEEQSLGHG